MRRFGAVAAALSSTLLLLAAASAHANPSLQVAEPEAKAGQTVHFSISEAERGARYVLQIGEEQVAREKARGRHGVSGEFAMPNLGDVTKAVTLQARASKHHDDDDDDDEATTLTHTLLYVAPPTASAAPVVAPLAVALVPAPASEAAPALLPSAQTQPAPSGPGGVRRRQRSPGPREDGRAREQRRSDVRHLSRRRTKRKSRQRTASGLRYVLGSGGAADPLWSGEPTNGSTSIPRVNAAPRATITPSSKIIGGGKGGASIAVMIPALLALAALALATVAVVRRRRNPRLSRGT